ncbi:PEP/pyruvate-binding domain-containing protein, partial [bacterium]|nr:PEP/pyruvate-binding domain-containing protein [bacterium]
MNFVPNDLPPLFPNLTGVLAYVLPSIVRLLSGLLAHGAPPAIGVYLGLLAAAPVFLVLAAAYVVALLLAFAAAIAASLISPGAAGGAAFVTGALGLGAAIYAVVRLVRAFAPPRLVVPFDRLPDTARARRHFGAKAVELARALREGELVPPGVAVRSLPESAPPERRAAHARRAARSIVRHFDAARPATGTQSSILYPQSSSLIVRSSFTAEDARDASYAGIFRSVLDVAPEEDAIARAIEDVLASAGGGARARYESAKGTRRQARLAVIVQRQIRETLGGTAASFDISTGRRDARLVEIERGGRATLLLRPSGAVEATAGSIDPATEAESAVQLAAGAATRIAARRGVDVHIEWGYDGALHIYQVREIAGESVRVTLARAEGLGPARALSPLSRDVHFGDRALAAG